MAASFLVREATELLGKLQAAPPPLSAPLPAGAALARRIARRIEQNLETRRLALLRRARALVVRARQKDAAPGAKQRLNVLRRRFDDYLTRRDAYADALQQRAVPELGVWLAGMDRLARDALPTARPLLTCVDRGDRARITQLSAPDGSLEASLIVIPRERLPSPYLATSLLHEVGHAVAAEFGLVNVLGSALEAAPLRHRATFRHWVSEIAPDLWALLHLGPLATASVMHVVSYPHENLWKLDVQDPHPTPGIRGLLSATLGHLIQPNPLFAQLASQWTETFPLAGAAPGHRRVLGELRDELPTLARSLLAQRVAVWGGRTLRQFVAARQRGFWQLGTTGGTPLRLLPPTLAVAALGQRWLSGLGLGVLPHVTMRALLHSWGRANLTGRTPAKKEWNDHDYRTNVA